MPFHFKLFFMKNFRLGLFSLFFAVAIASPTAIHAQGFLDKVSKVLDKVSGNEQSDKNVKRGNGKIAEVKIGMMTMAAYGDVPAGTRIDYLRAMRTGDAVTLYLIISDLSQTPLAVRMQNFGEHAVYAKVGGRDIAASYMSIGDSPSPEGVSKTIPVGASIPMKVQFRGIPADIKTIPLICLAMTGHPEMDASSHFFSFTFENVPVYNVGARAADDLKGPVKNVTVEDGQGGIMSQKSFSIEGIPAATEPDEQLLYDSKGQLVTVSSDNGGSSIRYFYDDNANLVKSESENDDYSTTTHYYRDIHDPYSLIVKTVSDYGGDSNDTVQYSDYRIDGYGNWLSRKVRYSGNPETQTEIRKIEYHDNE